MFQRTIHSVDITDVGIEGIEFIAYNEIEEPIYFNYKDQLDASNNMCMDSFNNKSFHSVLCFGRPGTGKSIFAKKLAKQLGKNGIEPNLLIIYCNSLLASSVSTQQLIDALNRTIRIVEAGRPMIVVFDEIDSITQERLLSSKRQNSNDLTQWIMNIFDKEFSPRVKNEGNLVVFGFTNDIENIDEAIRKRFNHHFYFDLPTDDVYLSMLEHYNIDNRKEVFKIFKENSLNSKVNGSNFMKACKKLSVEPNIKDFSPTDCANTLTAWCGPNLISKEAESSYNNQFASLIKTANITIDFWRNRK